MGYCILNIMFVIFVNYCCCDDVGSSERDVSRSKLASFVSLFLMHTDLIIGRTVSIISIISMDDMLKGVKTLVGFFSVSAFSIMYLSWSKLIFMFGIFSKAIFAGSSVSSSLDIICLIEFERFGFLIRG